MPVVYVFKPLKSRRPGLFQLVACLGHTPPSSAVDGTVVRLALDAAAIDFCLQSQILDGDGGTSWACQSPVEWEVSCAESVQRNPTGRFLAGKWLQRQDLNLQPIG